MNIKIHSFRHAHVVVHQPQFVNEYNELIQVLQSISDADIIQCHNDLAAKNPKNYPPKSISIAINALIKDRLVNLNWTKEPIFQDPLYNDNRWRLDFVKGDFSVEVGFNHSGSIAWNLLKPVLASELNHIPKALQTQIGVIITATDAMQAAGGFDAAIGTYEMYIQYLKPLSTILSVPLIIIGIEPPLTFVIEVSEPEPRKKIGKVVYINNP